jgi:hypothetical protein
VSSLQIVRRRTLSKSSDHRPNRPVVTRRPETGPCRPGFGREWGLPLTVANMMSEELMPGHRRIHVGLLGLALLFGACGGNPTRPSGSDAATIAGVVYLGGGATKGIHAIDGAPASGLLVTVSGTDLSVAVQPSGYFQLPGVPSGTVRLQFRDGSVNAGAELPNVRPGQLVEIEVQVNGSAATVVSDLRSDTKVSLCHSTGTGEYHSITVSDSAEPAHRAHGDAKVGEKVPGTTAQTFDQNCKVVGPSVKIKKSTNGDDADAAPGPTIVVGSPVTWTYVVTNTGTLNLTNVKVVDDRNVTVTCPGATLAVTQSMTCTGAGTAVEGQYRNLGSVTADSGSGPVSDSDVSHYFGRRPDDTTEGPKVELCHRTGNGSYHLIEVSVNAEPAHRAHGDAKIGEGVPGEAGKVFGAACTIR